MNKKGRGILLVILIIICIFGCIHLKSNKLLKNNKNDLINISYLSEDFMNNYFKAIGKVTSDEEKANMLIVISNTEISNSYGAKNIIEAPNNQYILQYDSKNTKNKALAKLKNDKSISSVEENIIYKTEEVNYNSWGIKQMSLDYATDIANTNNNIKDVTVAIIDTGCDLTLFNKNYSGRIIETYNVLEESANTMTDENGHGTHIAGTIAEGTPLNVKILPVKVSKKSTMYNTDIVAGINYITYNKKADVINMSFGSYYNSEAIAQAIDAANKQNIISVSAAGNDNTDKKCFPAALDSTISVASVDSELTKSSFSNYGSEITFAAPGTNIKSINGTKSGTSMATPHAVSAVAILKSYNKHLTLNNVVDILKENTIDPYYGYGLISFNNVQFCDNTYCDEYGVYKNLNKNIDKIEFVELKFTKYNYYSLTNIMASKIRVYYIDGTNEEMLLSKLPNLEVLNYDSISKQEQNVTIKTNDVSININVTNPDNYESGWEYNDLDNGRVELIGYKNHGLNVNRLYIPDTIDGKTVVSFADNVQFSKLADFSSYEYLYLPTNFMRIGTYSLSETSIKNIYGSSTGIEIGSHGLESSSIVSLDVPIIKIEDNAFKNDYELIRINVSKKVNEIGDYAFYNCKKLMEVNNLNDVAYRYVLRVGEYAFYNCKALSQFELDINGVIDEYAFANCSSLTTMNLLNVDSIGAYAFYSSGISKASFGSNLEVLSKSSFENCMHLTSIDVIKGRIESRAFWNSNISQISITSRVEYTAEDSFAYSAIKTQTGTLNENGIYKVVPGLGIVENGNKLLVGFTNAIGASNPNIPDYITETGNYAFTGNNTLENIIIPENVTSIGEYAFKDCYQLSNVYMFGNSIKLGKDTFKRTYEGEIKNNELIIYVHKDSDLKQTVAKQGLNYRHIEPDEMVVIDQKGKYKAFEQVDYNDISVKLIYHEATYREEILSTMNYGIVTPLSNGVGYIISYQDGSSLKYKDTYYTINAKSAIGYAINKNVEVKVEKATPTYTTPSDLTANLGQKLSEIELPDGFEWMDDNQTIEEVGNIVYKAKYIPNDTNNYEIVENIDIHILVTSTKSIITPNITIKNKMYDGTTTISLGDITVSNLEISDYSIVSAVASSADAGKTTAKIKLKLSNEKFHDYSFSNGKQEKEFIVDFEILKANINVIDSSKDVTVKYDGQPHSVEIDLKCSPHATVKYMDENNGYTLSKVPEYTGVGTYVIKYKVYIDDNYTEYFGQKTLIIENSDGYVIHDYSVDEINKYISKIMVNTDVDKFISHIDLSYGYEIIVDYKQINNKKLLYTGGKTKVTKDSDLYREYINIVIGDINGDGLINSADLLKIRQHLLGTNILSGAYYLSSDINYDDTINSADLLRVRQHLLNIKPIE